MKLARLIPRQPLAHFRFAHNLGVKHSTVETTENGGGSKLPTEEKPKDKGVMEQPQPQEFDRKPSFAKRLFVGNFDSDLMTYPEILGKEQQETLDAMIKPIENFFSHKVDSKQIDQDAAIPSDVLQGLKDLGLFGLQIPQEYGGLGLNATEFARVGEVTSLDGSIAVTLAAHQSIGLKGLLLYGTEEQKKKYLPKLATGETIAAFCLTEASSGSDAASIKCKAVRSQDGKTFNLTGSKMYISNGGIADFFTVFACTADANVDVKAPKRITAFAVERKFGGITNGRPEDKLGIRGSNTCEVHFEDTPVPVENIIGELGGGFKVAVNILNSGRFSMGSACAGAMRKTLGLMTEHVINRKQFGRPLKDFGLIQEKLGRLAMNTYVMESMSYLTAGMIDSNLFEDCAVESAIVKVLSSELAWHGISEAIQIHGGMGYMKDQPFELGLRDSRILQIFEGTNEILRLFIALMGVQHAGNDIREKIKQYRNPFQFPQMAARKVFERFRHSNDNPKLWMQLHTFLHPILKLEAEMLEYAVLRLQYATEILLERHGAQIVEEQLSLKRLADIAIDIFAMTAVLSRASRSACVGMPNSDAEISVASAFVNEAHPRIQSLVGDIEAGTKLNGDLLLTQIAEKVVQSRGYCFQHPLTKTYT